VNPRHPVHLTLKLQRVAPTFRTRTAHRAVRVVLSALCDRRRDFRVTAYTVQRDHLHLIVEADSADAFCSGVRSLDIRMAKRLNQALGRKGTLFADVYHRRELATPLEVRRAIAYVLLNHQRHAAKAHSPMSTEVVDPYSSAGWFDGWAAPIARERDPPVVSPAQTWLGRVGWKRHGLLLSTEIPGSSR
jgi:REP element-mobilizing transposase RayT